MAWIGNYTSSVRWDVIIYPCHKPPCLARSRPHITLQSTLCTRLLHSPSLRATGLSMRHETRLVLPFVMGWSKYRSMKASFAMDSG